MSHRSQIKNLDKIVVGHNLTRNFDKEIISLQKDLSVYENQNN
jgi:hypothetical protein